MLAEHLSTRDFIAGPAYSVADIALYGYLHVAHEAGYDLPAPVRSWLERVEATPRFMDDLEPYPANARPAPVARHTTRPASEPGTRPRGLGTMPPGGLREAGVHLGDPVRRGVAARRPPRMASA